MKYVILERNLTLGNHAYIWSTEQFHNLHNSVQISLIGIKTQKSVALQITVNPHFIHTDSTSQDTDETTSTAHRIRCCQALKDTWIFINEGKCEFRNETAFINHIYRLWTNLK